MSQKHVLIVDDSRHFALHVWRYVTRSVGVGEPDSYFPCKGVPFLSEDGEVSFWWIPAANDWQLVLDGVLRAVGDDEIWALVDILGEPGSAYRPAEVKAVLQKRPNTRRIQIVSAYHFDREIAWEEVLPKSRETLRKLREWLDYLPKDTIRCDGPLRHILITGAGFELCDERGGFGMPSTPEILENMGAPFSLLTEPTAQRTRFSLVRHESSGRKCFPVPADRHYWPVADFIEEAAKNSDLDYYWDLLIGHIRGARPWHTYRSEKRVQEMAETLHEERSVREAFRKSLIEHDWGHLAQSIAAAKLDWHAWLTTNYTQFANRAVEAVACRTLRPWRIVSTGDEGSVAMREELERPMDSSRRMYSHRYLFKLHGDIGHLQTMAIAGHDKETFSSSGIPVDNLYAVYTAAERYLSETLSGGEVTTVVWHIVGHGLMDGRLLNLISHTYTNTEINHVFLIVNPQPETVQEKLTGAVPGASIPTPRKLYAAEYMARLSRSDLPPVEKVNDSSWWTNLPPGNLEMK